jgi:DNA-binding MarR family transcriptional regulator
MRQNLDSELFFLLHDLMRLIRAESDRRARIHGMTRAQWGLMIRLAHHPGISQKELADLLEVEPISVARMVDRLESNGMLERRADAKDRRIWRLHLLPPAEPILNKITTMVEELNSFVTAGLAPATRTALLDGLIQMKLNLLQTSIRYAKREEIF